MTVVKKKPAPQNDNPPAASRTSPRRLIFGIVPGILLVGALALFLNLGSLAKTGVERIASRTLGVRVTIGAMDVSSADKTVTVTGLRVANPAEFRNPVALTIDKISLVAESLAPDLLVFRQVMVDGTDIDFEVTENDTNLTSIRRNVNENAAVNTADTAHAPPKVIVRELVFNGMTLHPSAKTMDSGMAPVDIASLRITGIGERQNGVLASEAIAQVLQQVTKTTLQSAMQAGYLKGMSPAALTAIKAQFGFAEGFREQAKQGFENLKTGIKNLFGGSGEKNESPAVTAPADQPE